MKALNKKFEQLEEDRSDVVAHLKRNLEEKVEEARELNERLLALEELKKQEQAEYKKKESAMQLEYRTMENTLNAEVKLSGIGIVMQTCRGKYCECMLCYVVICISRKVERVGGLEISPLRSNEQIRGAGRTNRETGGIAQDKTLRDRKVGYHHKGQVNNSLGTCICKSISLKFFNDD